MKTMTPNPNDLTIQSLLAESGWATRLAISLVGHERADDLLQETWLQALRSAPASGLASSRAWLATLMRRHATKGFRGDARRRDRERLAAKLDSIPPTEALLGQEDRRKKLVELVLALPDELREPLVLRYFEELRPRDIATRLGLPASTVRGRLQRGLAELRASLERDRGEDWKSWCLAFVPAGKRGAFQVSEGVALSKVAAILLVAVSAVLIGIASWHGFGGQVDTPDAALVEDGDLRQVSVEQDPPQAREIATSREVVASNVSTAPEWLAISGNTPFYRLRGICLDSARRPVPDVRVTAANLRGEPSAKSGLDGRFVLELSDLGVGPNPLDYSGEDGIATSVRLLFDGSTHYADFQRIELGAQVEIDLKTVTCHLARASVRGSLVTAAGTPARDAAIFLMKDFGSNPEYERILRMTVDVRQCLRLGDMGFLRSDSDGQFSIPNVPAGRYRAAFFANGHEGATSAAFEVGDEGVVDLDPAGLLACDEKASVRGRVLDANQTPVPGALVAGRCSTGDNTSMSIIPTWTDEQGRFCVPVQLGSTCRMMIDGGERGTLADIEVPAGLSEVPFVLQERSAPESSSPDLLASSPRLRGRVLLNELDIEHAWIVVVPASPSHTKIFAQGLSGPDGAFAVPIPTRDRVHVRVHVEHQGIQHVAEWNAEATDAPREDLETDLLLRPVGTILGRVLVPSSESLVGTEVRATSPGRAGRNTTIDARGEFALHGLAPGEWSLVHEGDLRKKAEDRSPVTVDLAPGATARVDLDLAGKLPARLVGHFSIDGKAPRGNWKLSLSVDHRVGPAMSLRNDGSFESEALERGSLRFQALSRGNAIQVYHTTFPLAVGENRLELDIETGSIEFSALPLPDKVNFATDVLKPCHLTWEGDDGLKWSASLFEAKKGRLTLGQVPVGKVELRYQREPSQGPPTSFPVVAEFEVRAGEKNVFECPVW